jgi:hypothetical protein
MSMKSSWGTAQPANQSRRTFAEINGYADEGHDSSLVHHCRPHDVILERREHLGVERLHAIRAHLRTALPERSATVELHDLPTVHAGVRCESTAARHNGRTLRADTASHVEPTPPGARVLALPLGNRASVAGSRRRGCLARPGAHIAASYPLDAMGPLRQVPMLHDVDREAVPAEPLTLPAVAGTLLDHS